MDSINKENIKRDNKEADDFIKLETGEMAFTNLVPARWPIKLLRYKMKTATAFITVVSTSSSRYFYSSEISFCRENKLFSHTPFKILNFY